MNKYRQFNYNSDENNLDLKTEKFNVKPLTVQCVELKQFVKYGHELNRLPLFCS